jgi:aminobenzoyl-glutamate utilization protein B
MKSFHYIILFTLLSFNSYAQQNKNQALDYLETKTTFYGGIAHTIWNYAEMGFQEEKSSALPEPPSSAGQP